MQRYCHVCCSTWCHQLVMRTYCGKTDGQIKKQHGLVANLGQSTVLDRVRNPPQTGKLYAKATCQHKKPSGELLCTKRHVWTASTCSATERMQLQSVDFDKFIWCSYIMKTQFLRVFNIIYLRTDTNQINQSINQRHINSANCWKYIRAAHIYMPMRGLQQLVTSCAAKWPPQYAPAPPWLLTFWPWSRCGSRMWPGVPRAKFRLPRPFRFRVRADVRDIRQTDRRTDDGRRSPLNAPLSGAGA